QHNNIDPGRLKQFQLVFRRQQQFGRTRGREQTQRVRVEGKNQRLHADAARIVHGITQQGLVANMDTVEIAESDDRPGVRWCGGFDITEDFHSPNWKETRSEARAGAAPSTASEELRFEGL